MADTNLTVKDNYQNIKGTLRPSFKIGPSGVELVSRVINDSAVKALYLKRTENDENGVRVFTERDLDDLYDVSIPNKAIATYSESADGKFVTFYLHDGRSIRIPTTISNLEQAGTVIGPQESVIGNVATFSDTQGQNIADSGHGIINTMSDSLHIDYSHSNDLPTASAIWNLVGEAKLLLYARLRGLIDSNGHTTEDLPVEHVHAWLPADYLLSNNDTTITKTRVCGYDHSHTDVETISIDSIVSHYSEESEQITLTLVATGIESNFEYQLKLHIDDEEEKIYSITGLQVTLSQEDSALILAAESATAAPVIWYQTMADFDIKPTAEEPVIDEPGEPEEPEVTLVKESFVFTSKSWADASSSWISDKDGVGYLNDGIQVTKNGTGASAHWNNVAEYNIKKIEVVYCTNASSGVGSIDLTIGSGEAVNKEITKDGGITPRLLEYNYETAQTGVVAITVNCTTNSIYICGINIYREPTE